MLAGKAQRSFCPWRRSLPLLNAIAILRQDSRPLTAAGPAVHLLRYRYRGWNASAADPVLDTTWALEEIASRHPGGPVVLVGHSMGGRAALWAAARRT